MTEREREILHAVLWEYKKTIPRGTPYPQIIVDAEEALWGWAWPDWTDWSTSPFKGVSALLVSIASSVGQSTSR